MKKLTRYQRLFAAIAVAGFLAALPAGMAALLGVPINGEMLNVGLLVTGYLLLTILSPWDMDYVVMHVLWQLMLLTFAMAMGAAMTNLLLRGEMAAAVALGVAFGVAISYAINEYLRVVFSLLDEVIALAVARAKPTAESLLRKVQS